MITGAGLLLSIGVALLIPNKYESTVALMPPDQGSLSSSSVLGALTGAGPSLPTVSASLMNVRTPGGTLMGLLSSRTAQDDLIDRFDLRRVYHCQSYIEARGKLTSQVTIIEDKPSGIISITVIDRDKYRARDLAAGYRYEIEKLINSVSTSSAHLERIFLEERLKSLKSDLDATSSELSKFSSRNATLNPQTQGQALIEAASRLQAELITAQSELYGLKAQYSDDNVRVRGSRARIDELQSQLRKMGGIGENEYGTNLKANQLYPSIRELPILGVTYSDLSRQLAMQAGIYETLAKQYELAKVQEAKEIPALKVLDEPVLAEAKSFPHRTVIVVFGTLVSAFVGLAWIVAWKMWNITEDSHPVKALGIALSRSIRGHNTGRPT
jgi:capsule polysaccharide export protein KpsE/RkpR